MGKNKVVIGTQWGDEGKGKIVDLLTEEADVIIRFQGGANAGHTLVVGGKKIILHLVPSGILHPEKKCLIGNGVVLDPCVFSSELEELKNSGIPISPERIKISYKTHLIMPYHKLLDRFREEKKAGGNKIGTTGRGIGPAYEDKAARIGIRACDILDKDMLFSKIERALEEKNILFKHYFQKDTISAREVMEEIEPHLEALIPYLTDVSHEIQRAISTGRSLLFEGAQGTHLDIDHGTYPFVTSSNTVASNLCAGTGCGMGTVEEVIGVVKAYTTRVGGGPFPTELTDSTGEYLQQKGGEFGATTGRKRRCGWLDLVVVRESVRLNNISSLVLTKLDVLSGIEEIRVCISYTFEGSSLTYPPQRENALSRVEPVYETLEGWEEDISRVSSYSALPPQAKNYIEFIEETLGKDISLISVGPDRSQTIIRP